MNKEDYMNLLKTNKKVALQLLNGFLSEAYEWRFVDELSLEDVGIEDDTHRIEVYHSGNGLPNRAQFELVENENASFLSIGFTINEIKDLINQHSVGD